MTTPIPARVKTAACEIQSVTAPTSARRSALGIAYARAAAKGRAMPSKRSVAMTSPLYCFTSDE